MRITKLLVTSILAIALLIPMLTISTTAAFGHYQVFPNDPVEAGYVTPDFDGVIDKKNDGWNDSVSVYAEPIDPDNETLRSEKTTAVNFAPTSHDIGIDADVYFGYDADYFYFAGDVDKFGIEAEFLKAPSDLSASKGFTGDVFVLTLDVLSKLGADEGNYDKLAPRYFVSYDAEGNGAIYHDASAENKYNNRDSMFAGFDLKANALSEEEGFVSVTETDDGNWVFEAAVAWDVIIADMYANAGTELTDDLAVATYEEILLSNKDWRASVFYRFCGFDIESGEYYTSAIFCTVDDSSLLGVPGQYTTGITVDTFGLVFYVCHEHETSFGVYASDDDYATFDKDGTLTYYCDVCGEVAKTEKVAKIPFTDVKAGQWYEEALVRCYNNGYFNGTSATKFSPNKGMTRAMFVQVLANWLGVDTSEYTCNFSDVKASKWYYGAVAWAYSEGITSGTSATKFSPDADLTREQAVTFFMNFSKYLGMYEEPTITGFDGYVDANKVSGWAKDAMLWGVENGIISSTSKTELKLSPKTKCNRITAAQMICNYEDWLIAEVEDALGDLLN